MHMLVLFDSRRLRRADMNWDELGCGVGGEWVGGEWVDVSWLFILLLIEYLQAMGQDNQGMLANEQELLKMFAVKGKVKEHNLTYLEHLLDHQPYILRQAIYNLEKQQQQAIAKIRNREHFNNPHLTNLVRFETTKEQGLCSKYFRVLSLWEFPRKTLAEENNERALSKQPYSQQEIRVLLRQVSQAMLTLQKHRIYHECLTSKAILVEQPLKFRVVDPICLPLHPNPELIYHKRSLKNIYLSPEQCHMIDNQDIANPPTDPYREDVFTAGMLVLESGLLQRQDDCYEQDCAKINWQQLDQNLSRFQERYGPQLRNVLGLMLTRQTSKRTDWQGLSRTLQTHSQNQSHTHPRLSQTTNNSHRVSVVPASAEKVQGTAPIQNNLPIINRTSYSPVRANLVRLQPPPQPVVQNVSPGRVEGRFSPNRVTQVQNQPRMKGSLVFNYPSNQPPVFNYPNNQQAIPRTSLPPNRPYQVQTNRPYQAQINRPYQVQNNRPYQVQASRGLPVNQVQYVNPINFNSYQPANSQIQTSQISKTPKPSVQLYLEPAKNEFKINSPTLLEQTPKESNSFELNQIEPVYVIEEFKNGSKFQGYKYKGKREGWGKYQYQEGGYYEGEWKNDMMCGKGKLYYQSGKIAYDGNLEQDLFHGQGTLYNELPEPLTTPFDYRNFEQIEEFWIKYDGQFRNDKKEGHGLLLLTNGESFEGCFHDDKVEGEGVYSTKEGRRVRAIWHQNKLQRQL